MESCKRNAGVSWIIPTDQPPPENTSPNVKFLATTLGRFADGVSDRLNLKFRPPNAYKICDIKPMLGEVLCEQLTDFTHFGYGDLDVIYGDIGAFYTDDLLDRSDALSTVVEGMCGHFAVFRNTPAMRSIFRRSRTWQEVVESPFYLGFDEGEFNRALRERRSLAEKFTMRPIRKHYVEQLATVDRPRMWPVHGVEHPKLWTWRDGHLRNDRDGDREFLYLHFMNWKSNRYRNPSRGPAPWPALSGPLVTVDWRTAARDGFCISPAGFTEIATEERLA